MDQARSCGFGRYLWLTDHGNFCTRFQTGFERASTKHEFFVTISLSPMGMQGVVMTTEGHIAALERRHQELDRQIQAEMQNSRVDDLTIAALKRKKLEVKDQLYKFMAPTQ
jgi:hypothetical protein